MLSSRNLLATLLAVAAVGANLPFTTFFTLEHYGGENSSYTTTSDFYCLEIDGKFNNTARSFQAASGLKCIVYDAPNCPNRPGERYITLESEEDDLSARGFSDAISSFSCFAEQVIGLVETCNNATKCRVDQVTDKDPWCEPIPDEDFNNSINSLKFTPGIECTISDAPDCTAGPGHHSTVLEYSIDNLTEIDFGIISSLGCYKKPAGFIGNVTFCGCSGCYAQNVTTEVSPCTNLKDIGYSDMTYFNLSGPVQCVGFDGPGCATRLENHRVDLDREIQNLTDIVSFSCVRSKLPVGRSSPQK